MRHVLKIIPSALVVAFIFAMILVVVMNLAVALKAIVALISIFLFVLGIVALANPGVHNCLSSCIVSDNHLYTPRFNLITGPPEQDSV
jgi:hypothetical protein